MVQLLVTNLGFPRFLINLQVAKGECTVSFKVANYLALFLSATKFHFIREGAIAILRAPVQPVQARVGLRDGHGGLVA
jgi:hypothetical protein